MNRRRFLSRFGTVAAMAALPCPAIAQSRPGTPALEFGLVPDAPRDQSARFQAMLDAAARERQPVDLPAGDFILSAVRLPAGTVLRGVPGLTRLIQAGGGAVLAAGDAETLTLEGFSVLGGARWSSGGTEALIDLRGVDHVSMTGCTILNGGRNAVYLERCGGRIRENTIAGAAQFALFSRDSLGLSITDNRVDACADSGIVIHRAVPGRDGSIVSGNRISDIGAASGGTGQWGNAVNVFRADDVIVADNIISGSAFSAIRGNTARNIQIIGNNCRASGETAVYAEFSFENAVIAGNVVDGAANGISVTNFNEGGRAGTVTGNIVRNLVATGPYAPDAPGFGTGIAVEADATVTGNMVEGAPLFGINAGWGPYLRDVVISANTVRDARYGIGVSAADGAGRALIRGNVVSAREAAIVAHAWGEPLGPDLAVDPSAAPANVIVSDNAAT